jgi:hypothetical protein
MSDHKKIIAVLEQHLNLATSSFSIGSFGAIAEFHRTSNEPIIINRANQLIMMTKRGAIQIKIPENVYPVAYEALSKSQQRWQQGVAFCLPKTEARMNQRNGLTELGIDKDAMDNADLDAILFDMGIDAFNIDFCIRTSNKALIDLLRQSEGRSFAELSNNVVDELISTSPTRVVLSKLGRVEIYQPIGQDKTPQGPHTHLLPKLLAKKVTHSANTPIPENYVPCLTLHPANPLLDPSGQNIPFDLSRFNQFEELLSHWGIADCNKVKKSVIQAVLSGGIPSEYPKPMSRETRATLRVTLGRCASKINIRSISTSGVNILKI